jgi:hypothetical protein
MLAPPHSLHRLLWRWCGHTLRGFFFFEAPAPAASASSRLRRLRVLLLPTCAVSSGTALCVLSPSSFSPPAASPAAPRPPTSSSIARSRALYSVTLPRILISKTQPCPGCFVVSVIIMGF